LIFFGKGTVKNGATPIGAGENKITADIEALYIYTE